MATTIGLVCPDSEDRRELALLAGEGGYLVHYAERLEEALEILRHTRPRLMLVADAPGSDAALLVREILRVSPLLPVVVALKRRDAGRAVELMRLGAAEVVPPPWTRESLEACVGKSLRFQGTAISIVPRLRPRKAPFYLLAVAVFFSFVFGYVSIKHSQRLKAEAAARVTDWELPYAHPAAMAFDGQNLWIVDWFSQSLYEHSRENMAMVRSVHFTDETPVSMLFAQGSAWTLTASGVIERRMIDLHLTLLQKYRSAAPDTISMAFDGLYLWTLDRQRRLHKHLMDLDLSEIASYPCPGADPVALAFDGKTLWSLDAANKQMVRHNLERPDEAIGRVPLPEYADGHYRPAGMAWDGERFWTVGEKLPKESGPARVFAHPILGN